MNKRLFLVLPCVLLAISWSSCKKCPDTYAAYILNDYVPYTEGNTFAMTDNAGRIIHFTATAYSDGYYEDRISEEQKCVDGSQVVHVGFTTDSIGEAFAIDQQGEGANGVALGDAFGLRWTQSASTSDFDAIITSSDMTANSGTTLVSRGPVTIGNRAYADVVELTNAEQLPRVVANHIWYNKTEGLLKVAFTDSTVWTIVN